MNRTKKFLQLIGWISLLLVMVILAACSPAETPPAAPTDAAEALSILPASGASQQAVPETGSSAEASAKVELETEPSQLQVAADSAPETVDSDAAPAGEMPAAEGEEQPAAQVEVPPFEGPLPPVDPSIGNLAPDFILTTLDGETVSLADLRGRPVVLNYWVTWCIPCRDEMPTIEALHQEYGNDGLVVLSVNGTRQDALGDVENLISDMGLSFPVLLDQSEDVYNSYRILFMPTSFFIDAHGIIQDIVLGSTDENGFRSRVEKLVNTVN